MTDSSLSSPPPAALPVTIEPLRRGDAPAIVAIDAIHSGAAKPEYWTERLAPFIDREGHDPLRAGFVARCGEEVVGYILAEGRAWEFGSALCGWIFAIGVHPDHTRRGVALALCREVCAHFKSLNIHRVRTMVRRDDIDVLGFFRSAGFRAGPFMELELEL